MRSMAEFQNAIDIPFQFVALQLDLDVMKPIELDPFRQGFRQPIADRFHDVGFE